MGSHTKLKEVFFHIVFWGLHLLFRVEITRFYDVSTGTLLAIELVELPQKIFLTYYIIYFLVPHFLKKEKYSQLAIGTLLGLVFIVLWRRLSDYYFLYPIVQAEAMQNHSIYFWNIQAAVANLIYILPSTATGVAIYFIRDWFINYKRTKELEKEKLQAELNYLKTQIHPHFLFNTLNNIYALTLKHHTKAPDAVLKLSALLSYMLYDTNEPSVALEKEIEQVQNLISLESLRYGDRLNCSFAVSGDTSVKIAPLVLIPFVENAFKHGVSPSLERSWVRISLHVANGRISFQVENSIVSHAKGSQHQRTGIGLINIRRRLELLYPNKHELRISSEDTFNAWLTLHIDLKDISNNLSAVQ